MSPSPMLRERIYRATLDRPSPTRRDRRAREVAFFLAAMAGALAVFFFVGGVRAGPRPTAFVVGTAIGTLALALAATWVGYARGDSMLGRRATWLAVTAIVCPILVFVWMFGWGLGYPDMAVWWPARPGFRCLGLSMTIAAWPLGAFALLRRRTDAVHPRATGAALGAASGTWAASLIGMWCPVAHPGHVALGHALPVVLLALAGAWIGDRVIAVRLREPLSRSGSSGTPDRR